MVCDHIASDTGKGFAPLGLARELFGEDAPGMNGRWALTLEQADRIRTAAPRQV